MSSQVTISKFSESFIHIDADRAILRELNEHLSFEVKNSQFLPAVRNHYWDGKIRLLNLRTQQLYLGLHGKVKEFCDANGYDCIYEDPLDAETPFSVDEFKKLSSGLQLSTKGKDITPYDYQERAVIHAIQAGRTLLLSATSSGKSLALYILLRYYLATQTGKILILVPTTNLVLQMYTDFQDYASKTTWNVGEHCHTICDGSERHTYKRVIISTWQALAVKERLPKEVRAGMSQFQIKAWNKQSPYILDNQYFEHFGVVFGDEAHTFAAENAKGGGELLEIMSKLVNAKYRVGTTGTLKDSKINSLILEGIFGGIYQVITTRELIDSKRAADLEIKCLQLQYSDANRRALKGKTYEEQTDFLLAHEGRNYFIRNLALSLKGNTLVLFERVETHGKILFEMIQEQIAPGRKLFFSSGEVTANERNEIRRITEDEQNAIIVGSVGTFSVGMSLCNLDSIIFAFMTKARVRVLQSIGRGLRLSDRKTKVTLYDICDDLACWNRAHTNAKENFSLQHFMERLNFYAEEQFDYRQYRIALELPNAK